jgi:YD repeat-containing protein
MRYPFRNILFRTAIFLMGVFLVSFASATPPSHPTLQAWTVGYDDHGHIRTEYVGIKGWLSPEGNWEKEERYDYQGKLLVRKTFLAGNLPQTETHFNPDKSINYEKRFQYDAQNRLVEQALYFSDGSLGHKWIIEYEEGNHIRERRNYDASGKLVITEVYTYDESGLKAEAIRGSVGSWLYAYDAQGRVIQKEGGPASADESEIVEYSYDARGRLVSEKTFHGNGSLKSETVIEYP